MKILLLGDASNYHNCLAKGLRDLGNEVVVASNGSTWMGTFRDIDLDRKLPGKAGGMLLAAKLKWLMASGRLSGWDVVQIGTPFFLRLRPARLKWLFDYIRANNKVIINTAYGSEPYWIDYCLDASGMRYNEWRIGNQPGPLALYREDLMKSWNMPKMLKYNAHVFSKCDGAVSALWEYHEEMKRHFLADKMAYVGIPIDVDSLALRPNVDEIPSKVRIFLGVHKERMVEKGTDRMLVAVKKLVERYPDKCELTYVESVPYKDYVGMMRSSHLILDQLYSYTPATNAMLAMAQGLVAVTGAEPEFYDFIGEHENHPIVNALPDDEALYKTLEDCVMHPERIPAMSRASRAFVEKHNHVNVVANRFLDFWKNKMNIDSDL
jgi:hypothetical protein